MTDIGIEEFLEGLGLTGEIATRARTMLEQAGITNPRKRRIALTKAEIGRAEIDRHLHRLCHACLRRAPADGRTVVQVPVTACSNCAGSSNQRAVNEMVSACVGAGVAKIVAVGGSPNMRRELSEIVGDRLELRLIDGTRSIDRPTARRDIAWADLIVVLASTQLAHKVSTLYTRDLEARRKLITTSRRGIEAIADEVTRSDVVRRQSDERSAIGSRT